MTRICENCEYINQDDYDFCAKCGSPLTENARPKNVVVLNTNNIKINKTAIILSYIITIVLSWAGFIVSVFLNFRGMAAFTFFGFFMPFYLIQSPIPTIKKHGMIQLAISLIGVSLSFYVLFK